MRQNPTERTPLTTPWISQQLQDRSSQPENKSNDSSLKLISANTDGGSLVRGGTGLGDLKRLPADVFAHIISFVDLETEEDKKYNIILTCRFFYLVFHTHFLKMPDYSNTLQTKKLLEKVRNQIDRTPHKLNDLKVIHNMRMHDFYYASTYSLFCSSIGIVGFTAMMLQFHLQTGWAITAGITSGCASGIFFAFMTCCFCGGGRYAASYLYDSCYPCIDGRKVKTKINKSKEINGRLLVRYNLIPETEEQAAISNANNTTPSMNRMT